MSADFLGINMLDVILALCLLFTTIRGYFRGLAQEIGGLIGILLALFAAGNQQVHQEAVTRLRYFWNYSLGLDLLAYAGVFVLAYVSALVLSSVLKRILIQTSDWPDRLLGGCAGLIKGGVLISLLLFAFAHFAPDSEIRQRSLIAPRVNALWIHLDPLTGGFRPWPVGNQQR